MQEYKQPLKVLMLDGTRLMHTIDIVLGMWQAISMIKYRNKMLKDLVYRVGSQHQSRKYESCMTKLKQLDEKCLEWFNRLDMKKWTLAHDGRDWYGWMITTQKVLFDSL